MLTTLKNSCSLLLLGCTVLTLSACKPEHIQSALEHGGSVALEDRPGGGTRARLALPLAREDGSAR